MNPVTNIYSLRRSLVVPAVAIMVVLSLGLVGLGYWAGDRIVNMMSEQLIRHMSTSIRDHVTIMMDAPPRLLARVRDAVKLHKVSLKDPAALGRELYALLDHEPGVDWLYFANEAGGIVSVGRLGNGERVILMTDGFRAGVIREYAATAEGDIATLRKSGGYFDARQKDWYKTAKDTGKSIWTEPYIGSVEPILGVSLSAPARGRKGEFAGVFGLDLILTRLSDFMKRQRLGKTGRAFLVDQEGYLIASSGPVSPVVIDAKGRQQRVVATNAPDPVVRAAARYLWRHPGAIALPRKAVQSFVFEDEGLGRISTAVEQYETSSGNYWLVVSALPVSEFLGVAYEAGLFSLGFMVILILGALAGGFWAVNRVLRPVEALTSAARVITDGGWPDVPETHRKDEIGVLARALAEMTGTLRIVQGELEKKVAERTAELRESVDRLTAEVEERRRIGQALETETAVRLDVQAELHQKEMLLLQQSRLAALGEMIGNIAHQWRQPLNLLGLMVQELPMTYKSGDFSKAYLDDSVKRMLDTIWHMSKTIDDFRSFSTPEKEKVDFNMLEVVNKTVSLLEGSINAHQIKATVVDADVTVNGYPNQFSQALLNLIVNARDALVANKVAFPVIAITVGAEDGRCVVTVTDNAGGVPAGIADKIFDPYFTTKGPDQGTGIGLYMAKVIIEKNMGGRISVRNTADGAEFRIELAKA